MADEHTLDEYEELYRQVEDLKMQNEVLKMEQELRGFRKELTEHSRLSSTPATGKLEQSQDYKKVRLGIPRGRPDDAPGADAGLSELQQLANDIPDKFVTTRKKPMDSTSKPKDVAMKPATFDGSVAWADYKAHFEACAELNGWT